ncbi:uncharacterized protein LOC131053400 isoform X3 [Cryptomeria japonica]|uniref:uncharacterized protein LOC131053400 isoform X3 n=1 Tax=Cryptomeria japonica TaxID=3369 RepID=UPI0027DA70CB|nr:uncharacterized protein LOC131053400 isoform X3 [Cryptomeria japonica]
MRSRLRASKLILLCFLLWLTFCLQVFSKKCIKPQPQISEDDFSPPSPKDKCLDQDSATERELGSVTCDAPASSSNLAIDRTGTSELDDVQPAVQSLKEPRPFDNDIEIPEDEFSPPSLKDECLNLDSATLRELGSVTCDAPASSSNFAIDRTGTSELHDVQPAVQELGSVTCDAPASSPNFAIDRTGTSELDDVQPAVQVQLGQIRAPTRDPSLNSTTLFIYEPQGLTFRHGQNFAFNHFQLLRPSEETEVLHGMRALLQRINRQQQQPVQLGQIRAPTRDPSLNSTTLFIYEPQGLTFRHGQNFAFNHFQLLRPSEETEVLHGMRALLQRINRQQQQPVQLGQIRAPTRDPSLNSTTLFIYEPQGLTFRHGQNFAFNHFQLLRPSEETEVLHGMRALLQRINRQQQQPGQNFAFNHFQLPRPSEETQVLRGMRALPQGINRQQQQPGSDTLNGEAEQQIMNRAEGLTKIVLWFALSSAVAFSVYSMVMYPWNKVEPVMGYFFWFTMLFGFGIFTITGRTTSPLIFVRDMISNIINFLFRRPNS